MDEPLSKLAVTALCGIAGTAVTALALALRNTMRPRRVSLTEPEIIRVREEIDHVLNNFAMVLIDAFSHAERGYWLSAKESIERWSRNHPAKRG